MATNNNTWLLLKNEGRSLWEGEVYQPAVTDNNSSVCVCLCLCDLHLHVCVCVCSKDTHTHTHHFHQYSCDTLEQRFRSLSSLRFHAQPPFTPPPNPSIQCTWQDLGFSVHIKGSWGDTASFKEVETETFTPCHHPHFHLRYSCSSLLLCHFFFFFPPSFNSFPLSYPMERLSKKALPAS